MAVAVAHDRPPSTTRRPRRTFPTRLGDAGAAVDLRQHLLTFLDEQPRPDAQLFVGQMLVRVRIHAPFSSSPKSSPFIVLTVGFITGTDRCTSTVETAVSLHWEIRISGISTAGGALPPSTFHSKVVCSAALTSRTG